MNENEISDMLSCWNAQLHHNAMLIAVGWELASVPTLGEHPQKILNKQIIGRCQLLVAVFWSKLGTPTPIAPSGTVEEIDEFINLKGPGRVMLYFCTRDVPPESVDQAELSRLRDYKAEMQSRGLYYEYRSLEEFERVLYQHLDAKVAEFLAGRLPPPGGTGQTAGPNAPLLRLDWPYQFGEPRNRVLPIVQNGDMWQVVVFVLREQRAEVELDFSSFVAPGSALPIVLLEEIVEQPWRDLAAACAATPVHRTVQFHHRDAVLRLVIEAVVDLFAPGVDHVVERQVVVKGDEADGTEIRAGDLPDQFAEGPVWVRGQHLGTPDVLGAPDDDWKANRLLQRSDDQQPHRRVQLAHFVQGQGRQSASETSHLEGTEDCLQVEEIKLGFGVGNLERRDSPEDQIRPSFAAETRKLGSVPGK